MHVGSWRQQHQLRESNHTKKKREAGKAETEVQANETNASKDYKCKTETTTATQNGSKKKANPIKKDMKLKKEQKSESTETVSP